jgi:hypothetical protein
MRADIGHRKGGSEARDEALSIGSTADAPQ